MANILYKYCDQVGSEKILESLELKLPYISWVNDPFECLPIFECKGDMATIEKRYFLALKHKNMIPSTDYKQKMTEQFKTGEIQRKLIDESRKLQENWNQVKGCLLCVSKTAQNTVMWAHYADKHKGAVIGIDFDDILPSSSKIRGFIMSPVKYSKHRARINCLSENHTAEYLDTLLIKSIDWGYEMEFRTVFLVDDLENLYKQGYAFYRDFKGRLTWFLRLNPKSIKEIIFGLYAEENLKLTIRKLIERPKLQHIKLWQATEAETYALHLVNL